MSDPAAALRLRLLLARACAWALLVAGWIGIGSFALLVTSSVSGGFALVALWLFALGAAAAVATRGGMRPAAQWAGLVAGAAATVGGLGWTVHAGGVVALLVALAGWASLTAMASGVVRSLRLAQAAVAGPPIAAATLGAPGSAVEQKSQGSRPPADLVISFDGLGVGVFVHDFAEQLPQQVF